MPAQPRRSASVDDVSVSCCFPCGRVAAAAKGETHGQRRHGAAERAAAVAASGRHQGPWTHRNVLRLLPRLRIRFRRWRRRLRLRLHPARLLRRRGGQADWLAGGQSVPIRGRAARRRLGHPRLLCVFIGGGFWLATALGWSFFMFGAAWAMCISCSSRATSLRTTSCRRLPTRSSRFGCSGCSTPTGAAAASRVCCAENAETSQRLRTGAVRKGREDHPEQVLVLLFRSSCGNRSHTSAGSRLLSAGAVRILRCRGLEGGLVEAAPERSVGAF